MIALQLGLEMVPAIELGHLSEAQKPAYVLADNRHAERARLGARAAGLEVGNCWSSGSLSAASA